MNETITYAYDATNNMASKIDAKGQKAQYTYDDTGNPTSIDYYPDTVTTTPEKTVSLAYNARDSLTGYDDGTTSAIYTLDLLQRKTQEVVNYPDLETADPNDTFALAYQYSYYANSQKQSYTAIDGTVFSYAYNEIGQLQSIALPGEGVISYSDFYWNRPAKTTFPGGTVRTVVYDGLLRIRTLQINDQDAQTQISYDYEFDGVGNVTQKTTGQGIYTYGYDAINRVTSADYPTLSSETFAYDALGNRTRHSRTGTTDWQYNQNNELINSVDNQWLYDENGASVEKQDSSGAIEQQYVYNIEGRMSEIKDGAGSIVAQYYFDPFGRRLTKTLFGQAAADARGDGDTATPFVEYMAYSDEGYAASQESQGEPLIYHYSPEGIWSTDPIFRKEGATYYYYQTDHLGTPMELVSKTGELVLSREMEAFGKATSLGPVSDRLGFAGQVFDSESGLRYNYFRDYDAGIGRFIQSDPIGLNGGTNVYGYVLGNPIVNYDPDGQLIWGVAFFFFDLGVQWYQNGGNFDCIDWVSLGLSAVGGGLIAKTFRKLPGLEWSHHIPDRYIRPRSLSGKNPNPFYKPWISPSYVNSRFNGNWVRPRTHALTDDFRNTRGFTRDDKLPKPVQQFLRIPGVYPGSAATGAAIGRKFNCGCN